MWGLELSQQCEQFFSIIVIFFGIICYGYSYIIIKRYVNDKQHEYTVFSKVSMFSVSEDFYTQDNIPY